MNTDPTYDIPISTIKHDNKLILEYHARKESAREQHRHLIKNFPIEFRLNIMGRKGELENRNAISTKNIVLPRSEVLHLSAIDRNNKIRFLCRFYKIQNICKAS